MRSVVVALALVVGGVAGEPAQAGVAGDWVVTFNTPQGARDVTMAVKVDGTDVSGTLASELGEVPFKGTAKGNTFSVTFDVQTQNGTFSIAMNGEVTGDEMKGSWDFGQGVADFAGKRKD